MRARFLTAFFLFILGSSSLAQPIGKKLPDFQLKRLDGSSVSLEQLRNSSPSGVLMLTFWCTQCASCRNAERPLAELAKRMKGKATVLGVVSASYDTSASAKRFLTAQKISLDMVTDPGSKLARYLDVSKTTTTIIVDKNARLRYYGTLLQRNKFYGKENLDLVMRGKIVGHPIGPEYG